jgi:hypothetical protein
MMSKRKRIRIRSAWNSQLFVDPRSYRQTYEFMKANRNRFDVRTMCRVLQKAPSGQYAGLQGSGCQ